VTTTLSLVIGDLEHDDFLTARLRVERVVGLVQQHSTVAFIHEDSSWGERMAAVIPAALAEELIKEGRIGWPLYTSRTVVAPR